MPPSSAQVGDVGASVVAKALFRNTSLTALNLSSNQIGAAGGEALAEVLGAGAACALLQLDVSGNRLGEPGGTALGNAIAGNTVSLCAMSRLWHGNPAAPARR